MIYRFGDHALDTESFRLTANGEEIAVEPQVFSLLLYLIEHRDRVVSKDEIIERVWDGRIVSDGTLTSRINSVRRAVGDDGKSQAVIRTFPRRGSRFVAAVTVTEENEPEAASPLPDKPSIAVLPFENMSDDPQQEYFSDGMAEDLITDLSKISGLFVVARNSSFAFKGHAADVKEIAGRLGVRHILEGSVRKMGDRLRVNAQLVDATSGGHLWAERYDGDMADIFGFQDSIRAQIVAALQVSLTPTDKALTARKPTESPEAYDLFLRGRENHYLVRLPEARQCLERAIEIDPNFADAYAYLSFVHFAGWAQMEPGFEVTLDRANELAERGVALDGASAIALSRLGWIQLFLRRYDQAIENFEKAIGLAPDDGGILANFGHVLNYWGDPQRGQELIEKALGLETFSPSLWEFQLGVSHFLLRHYDDALGRFNQVIERTQKIIHAYTYMACTYVELDRLGDARKAISTLLKTAPRITLREVDRVAAYRRVEDRNRILDALRKAGLPEEG